MKTILSAFLISALLLPAAAHAADLGDPAPDLKIAKWVKGEPVQISKDDPKQIYVVEFWATWCPPCRTSIPHLTEIQKRFKDQKVTIIGVTDEKESTVKPFVDGLGEKMDYRVAIDQGDTAKGYMKAYGVNGIPHAFIVQEQKIIWHGHPMAGLDKTLAQMVAGKYDLAKAKAALKADALYNDFRRAAAEGDDAKADELAAQINAAVKDGTFTREFNADKEKKLMRASTLRNRFMSAESRGESEKAAQYAKELQALDPTIDLKKLRDEVAMHKSAQAYFEAISGENESADPKKLAGELGPKLKNNPEIANNVAWAILTDSSIKKQDFEFAAQVAKQAVEDSEWKAPHIIDTYARALFETGKKEEAIATQEKALALVSDGDKAQYEQTLKSYKEGKAPKSE